VHEINLRRDHVLDAILQYRVGLPTAYLHDRPRAGNRASQALDQTLRGFLFAVFFYKPHFTITGCARFDSDSSLSSASNSPLTFSSASARSASASSMMLIAKPTCTSTKSLTAACGTYSRQTARLMPAKLTRPILSSSCSYNSTICPGIAKHIS